MPDAKRGKGRVEYAGDASDLAQIDVQHNLELDGSFQVDRYGERLSRRRVHGSEHGPDE
jgi:hypothetical protein